MRESYVHFIEKRFSLLSILILLLIGLVAIAQSAIHPVWYDECATLLPASLSTLKEVWGFYSAGLDTPSPIPSIIEHFILKTHYPIEIVGRLPMIAGFLVMCVCLSWIVHRRYPAGYALSAMLFPAMIGFLYERNLFEFATIMRGYSITLGGVAFALWCWQSSETKQKLYLPEIGVFLGLSVAIAFHFYAIFVLPAFCLGQFVRDKEKGVVDFASWSAILLSPCILIAELPGMIAAQKFYGHDFYAKPHLGNIAGSYYCSFQLGWMIPLLIVLLVSPALFKNTSSVENIVQQGYTKAEWYLISGLALLPAIALPVSIFLGVYVSRYVLPLNIGVALLIIGATAGSLNNNRRAGCLLAALLVVFFLLGGIPSFIDLGHVKNQVGKIYKSQKDFQCMEESHLPVVIQSNLAYFPIYYYASDSLRKRLFYATNKLSMYFKEPSSGDVNMILFSKLFPLQVVDYKHFVSENPHFLLTGDFIGEINSKDQQVSLIGHFTSNNHLHGFGLNTQTTIYEVNHK